MATPNCLFVLSIPPQCSGYSVFFFPPFLYVTLDFIHVYLHKCKTAMNKNYKMFLRFAVITALFFLQVRSSVTHAVSLGEQFFCNFLTLEDEGTTFL
jgi:hypothetical protein